MRLYSSKIKSKFKQNESFDYMHAPKKFESVTDSTLRRLNRYCIHENKKLYKDNTKPGAVKAMIQAVAGKYNMAHACLEGDYATRKGNLENEYITGIADVNAKIISFQAQIAEHKVKLDNYRKINYVIYGEDLPAELDYTQVQLNEIKSAYNALRQGVIDGRK